MNQDRERLAARSAPVEFRAASDDADHIGTLAGYAAVYNRDSVDLGGFTERIAPGAFNKTVGDKRDVVVKFNHDPNLILGRTAAGTARLDLRDDGLWYEVDLPDTTTGRDVKTLAERGDITASSFEFRTIKDSWEERDDGTLLRTLLEVSLYDAAPVTNPAYPDSSVALKRFAEARGLDAAEVTAAAAEGRITDLLAETREDNQEDEPPAQDHGATSAGLARARALELLKREPAAG